MKTGIVHLPHCASHNKYDCDCSPTYKIHSIEHSAYDEARSTMRVHEGQTEEREDYFVMGGTYVTEKATEILKLKMNPDNSMSAKEYWYRCGIQDAISLLKEFETGKH